MKPALFINTVSALLVLLFSYTGISKLIDPSHFKDVLHHSPVLAPVAGLISRILPPLEVAVAIQLLLPSQRKYGLYISFSLLIIFTAYLSWMLISNSHLPCACGGVVQQLSWRNHLLLNVVLLLATGVSLKLLRPSPFFSLSNHQLFIAINRGSPKPVKKSRHHQLLK